MQKRWNERLFWFCIAGTFLGTVVLGLIGFRDANEPSSAVYKTLQLFVLNYDEPDPPAIPLSLAIARMLGAVTSAATVVRAVLGIFNEQWLELKRGYLKNHIVICGLGLKGYELVRQFLPKHKVVIIENDEGNDYINTCRDKGAYVLLGDVTDTSLLKKARVRFAREIYFFTGSDGANFSALSRLADSLANEKNPRADEKIKAWLHLNSTEMCSFLRNEAMMEKIHRNMELEIVNLYENLAHDLVVNHLIPLLPVRPDDNRRIHLFLVGLGRMGRSTIRRLAQCAITANGQLPCVTVVSRTIDHDLEKLRAEFPGIDRFCEIDAFGGDILHGSTRTKIIDRLIAGENEVPVVCFAAASQYVNIRAALYFAKETSKDMGHVPWLIRGVESEGWGELASELSGQQQGCHRMVQSFGLLSDLCDLKALGQTRLNDMARVLHQGFLSRYADGSKPSHNSWDTLAWEYRDSNRQAAIHLRVKLRTIGLTLQDNPDREPVSFEPTEQEWSLLAQLEHRRYCVERELARWVPGEETDPNNRVHASLVKWEALAPEEQEKDFDQIKNYAQAIEAGNYMIVKEDAHD